MRELKDSGYWVENTNLNGGRQYKDGEDVEVPETPTTSTDPENPGETTDPENPNPENPGETTDPENPSTGEGGDAGGDTGEDAGIRIVAEPAMRSFVAGADRGTAPPPRTTEGFADGESTEVTDPGDAETCTHENKTYTGNKQRHPRLDVRRRGTAPPRRPTRPAPTAMATASCDGCGDCLHLHDRTYTYKDADVHTVTCADCNEVLGEEPHADANGNGMCDGCGADMRASTPSLSGRTTSTTPIPLSARSAASRRARRPMWTPSTTRPRLPAPRRRRAPTGAAMSAAA